MAQQPIQYLMIENPGEAPIGGLLLMGATTKDAATDDTVIGMFGSGTKYAVLALLRKNCPPIITSGRNRLEWHTQPIMVGNTPHMEVLVSINGRKPKPTGTTLNAGKSDWQSSVSLGLREFVSNALDSVGGNKDQVRYCLTTVPHTRAGFTRVFIPWPDLSIFETFLQTYFLHWRPGGAPAKAGPISKTPGTQGRPQFYRRGVLIRSWSSDVPSLWDYNFTDLVLDEARNSNDWNLQHEAGKLLGRDSKALATTMWAVSENPSLWEAQIGTYTLQGALSESRTALLESIPAGVVFGNQESLRAATNKGLTARTLPSPWLDALNHIEGPTTMRALGEWAHKGVDLAAIIPPGFLARVSHFESRIAAVGLPVRATHGYQYKGETL